MPVPEGKNHWEFNDNPSCRSNRRMSMAATLDLKQNIANETLQELRATFSLLDISGQGFINLESLVKLMENFGYKFSKLELVDMLADLDLNKDEKISFEEFLQVMLFQGINESPELDEDVLRRSFQLFDRGDKGFIEAADLSSILKCFGLDLSVAEVDDLIEEFDVEGDGRIKYQDFLRQMKMEKPERVVKLIRQSSI